jgi:FSR family fosmidomycin resistance protein-like MFS transporter
MEKRKVFLVGGLHFAVDLYAGFFAIYMVLARLDPAKAALVTAIASFIANSSQPLQGYWADRVRGKIPVFISVLAASLFLSSIGLTRDYSLLFFLQIAGMLGVSLFHPAGSNIAAAAGLERKERSFSIFVTIGTFGLALSQPCFSAFTGLAGLRASPLLAIPGIFVAFFYLIFSRTEVAGPKRRIDLAVIGTIIRQKTLVILVLFLMMVFRQGFIMSLGFFIAKMFSDWGFSRITYSLAGTIYTFTGALGVLAAGYISHRVKAKTILLLSLIGFLPPFVIMILAGQRGFLWPTYISLALTGFLIQLSHVPIIIMGHRILPEGTSTISGVLMGFAWSVGMLSYPLVPMFSDLLGWAPGLASGMVVLTILPLSAAALIVLLPGTKIGGSDTEGA